MGVTVAQEECHARRGLAHIQRNAGKKSSAGGAENLPDELATENRQPIGRKIMRCSGFKEDTRLRRKSLVAGIHDDGDLEMRQHAKGKGGIAQPDRFAVQL